MLTILVTPVPLNRGFWEQPLQCFNIVSGGRWSVSVYSTLFPIDIECRVYGEPITDRELGGAGAGLLPAPLAKTWLLSPLSSVSAFYRLPITRDPALSNLGQNTPVWWSVCRKLCNRCVSAVCSALCEVCDAALCSLSWLWLQWLLQSPSHSGSWSHDA